MQQQVCRRFRFISSSLLFAYGQAIDSAEEQVRVTVIDFGHTFRVNDGQVDANYTNGLQSVISFLEPLNC